MAEIQKTHNLFDDVRHIIEKGRATAYAAVEQSVIVTNWFLGQRIVEEEQERLKKAKLECNMVRNLLRNWRRSWYLCMEILIVNGIWIIIVDFILSFLK